MTLSLKRYGPWTEISTRQAARIRATGDGLTTFVLSVIETNGELSGHTGFHFVNVESYFRSTRPMPWDFFIEEIWYDEDDEPVTGDE